MNTVTSKVAGISLKRGEATKYFNLDENLLGSPMTVNIIINSVVVRICLVSPWGDTSIDQEWLAEIGR